jgi:transcriptional regulator with XRE-family HTH domain
MKFIDNKAVGERLKRFREEKNLSARRFAIGAELDPSHYGKVERGELPVTEAMLSKLTKGYGLANDFVLYGQGTNVPHEPSRDEIGPPYRTQLWLGKIMSDEHFVPFVPYQARAGYSSSYEDSDKIKENFEMYAMPPGIPWRGTEWRWFEVGGSSMEPLLLEKDILLCSMIPHADWLTLDPFLIYVVVWKNEVSVKRVAIDKGDFVLISENESEKEPQKRIAIKDVKEVWKLRRQLNARFPPTKKFKITV